LVVVQLGLALSLLVAASLFIQAFAKVMRHDAGFRLEGVMAAAFVLPDARYADADRLRAFQRELGPSLGGLPGQARAAIASDAPLDWGGPFRDFQVVGHETSGNEEEPRARWSSVSADYFGVLGLKLVTGRGFNAADRAEGQPVAVISRSLADKFFPGQSPIGQRLKLPPLDGFGAVTAGVREIVGVVSDVTTFNGLQPPEGEPRMYELQLQQPTNQFNVVVRGGDDVLSAAPALRRRIEGLDAQLGVGRIESMQKRFDRQLWQGRFFYKLMVILGALALLLAAVGVYGVVSYSTARRTREFGIRAALGAEPRQIAALVLAKALTLAAFGLGLGLLLALVLSRVLQRLLYDISARDPATLLGVAGFLLAVTVLASLVPTLRATRASPMESLRVE
jgi:predicted permease